MTIQLQVLTSRQGELAEREARIEANLRAFVVVGRELMAIRDGRLYKEEGYRSFDDYLRQRWPSFDGGRQYADRVIAATTVTENLTPLGVTLPVSEWQARPLAVLPAEHQAEAWRRALAAPVGKDGITEKVVAGVVAEVRAELAARDDSSPADEETPSLYTVAAWNALPDDERRRSVEHASTHGAAKFNKTNGMVEWALWTWNPVTGCDHGCDYCYARDIANRYYVELPEGERFAPVFRPSRLSAPRHTKVPDDALTRLVETSAARHAGVGSATDEEMWRQTACGNVFVCSMADLFGKWVPQDWIDAVFAEVVRSPQWNYLFLTKFPQRLAEQAWPENAWCGTTVDRQARVGTAERSFRGVTAGVKWLSCEPLLERLTFSSLEMFDWVVIGASSRSSQTPEFQPPWEWVEHLMRQAREAGCRVYVKPNLKSRPREYPG